MNDRIPEVPPVIAPIAGNEIRPVWSVMIPTYNCIQYVMSALESVLAQDPGQEFMQIEVIDDCSTDGDVGKLVQEVGKGRVGFYKQPENRGSLRNFETCVNRSKGVFVHLLHGDDCIKRGFYDEIKNMFDAAPEIGAAYTKSIHIDPAGNEMPIISDGLPEKTGIVEDFLFQIASFQKIQPPSIVVKRSVYENLGGFFAVKYGEDWEMWIRIAAHYKVSYSPKGLALYRAGHPTNISNQSVLTGQNIKDITKVIDIVQAYLPVTQKKILRNIARKNFSIHYAMASYRIYPDNKKMAFIQAHGAISMHKNLKTFYYVARLYLAHFLDKLGINTMKKSVMVSNTVYILMAC